MPKPRKALVLLEETPYYHCVSRCVRRAFLCGEDTHTGESYEHRRQWIVDRMKQLVDIFAIDICSYAVLHNHYHVILHVDSQLAIEWDDHEVIERWGRLFSLPVVVQRYLGKEPITQAERDTVSELLTKWRTRLYDISWFMRCLNEPIARMANKDDGCTGRFWEGRYKSQALLDEKALAACMAYVDLNPLRAGLAETPKQSEYTSIKERTHLFKQNSDSDKETHAPRGLLPFVGYPRKDMPKGVPFRFVDYLELVDWTGRAILDNKRGYIPNHIPPVLDRLQIDSKHWLYMAQHFESRFKGLVGASHALKAACRKLEFRRTPNLGSVIELLS
ncbi:MAG: transposase [Candidatus Thiodiazotropha sp. LLP2]